MVKLEAVKEDGNVVRIIQNPSEAVKLEAVKNKGCAIQFIDDPSVQVQLEAVKQCSSSAKYIKNICKEVLDILDIIDTKVRTIYVLHEEGKEPLFSIGCQQNITKEKFIDRIKNLDGGLKNNPHRKEYLEILKRY